MGGFFGVASRNDCVTDVFFGTDYHSHLGTRRGGLAFLGPDGFGRSIHDISNTPFRTKFEDELPGLHGRTGIGVISDTDSQPLIIRSHLGTYAIVTVGAVRNAEEIAGRRFGQGSMHLAENSAGEINPTELVAALINQGASFTEGIAAAQRQVTGSCSMLVLTDEGIYAARDVCGRTPIVIGSREGAYAATLETCAFPNLGFEVVRDLGPGEIVQLTADGHERMHPPDGRLQICAFLWVYYGYPASSYEGVNVELVRNRCGMMLARRESMDIDVVAGIPDSGIGHAIGYAGEAGIPYRRPFVKYTPTWPRSFMPQEQRMRDLVAKMKLIPIRDLIAGSRMLFCEDSIVRGTQLQDTIQRLFDCGALEVHMRPACPPLLFNCKFLNFSRSRSELDLAARRAVEQLERDGEANLADYARADSERHLAMVDRIRQRLGLTSLSYQRIEDLVEAIGLPRERLCTYCWDGVDPTDNGTTCSS